MILRLRGPWWGCFFCFTGNLRNLEVTSILRQKEAHGRAERLGGDRYDLVHRTPARLRNAQPQHDGVHDAGH